MEPGVMTEVDEAANTTRRHDGMYEYLGRIWSIPSGKG